ncbi:AAA family ATPase [bacterium]|nr:AAA family ATPase [bacterium]
MHEVKLAVGKDFFSSYSRLPKAQQKKTEDFIKKFQSNPDSTGINLEKFDSVDENLRSVRIDRDYRGIVFKEPKGNVFILLWVDHHDDAYDWGRSKRMHLNPAIGALQLYDEVILEGRLAENGDGDEREEVLFAHVKDKDLLRLGIPEPFLPLVRIVKDEAHFDELESIFPEEAAEALLLLAAGCSVEEAWAELETARQAKIDAEDYASALAHPDSQRRFRLLSDDAELDEMLQAPLEHWRVFLHPTQRKVVEMQANGPIRVLGGAGTGKTVAAMHRVKWLLEHVVEDGQRILFTTFTRNLATDIQENLRQLLSDEQMKRVDVVNIDRWADVMLRHNGYEFGLHFHSGNKSIWEQVLGGRPLDYPAAFLRDEWEWVVQEQGIITQQEYLRAQRSGRGTSLTLRQRMEIWPLFEEYRRMLDEKGLMEPMDVARECRGLIERAGSELPYRAVVVDEAQDMRVETYRLLRAIVPPQPNDMFIVGDAHQRIYGQPVVLGRCGIEIRGRARRLRVNYRTTEETRRWAVALLEGRQFDDLDGEADSLDGYRSLVHGSAPVVQHFPSFGEEVDFICARIAELREEGVDDRNICLTSRTNEQVNRYSGALEVKGLQVKIIDNSMHDDRSVSGIRLATMHRVKGLEFGAVFVAGMDAATMPLHYAMDSAADAAARAQIETMERSLLHVAVTRARRRAFVTGWGERSPLLVNLT